MRKPIIAGNWKMNKTVNMCEHCEHRPLRQPCAARLFDEFVHLGDGYGIYTALEAVNNIQVGMDEFIKGGRK